MEPSPPNLSQIVGTAQRGDPEALQVLVTLARDGDGAALEGLVVAIQDPVYRLAIRMLYHPSDAADATQEILIRIVTHLGTLTQPRAFRTWAFRIAANTLLTTRQRRAEQRGLTFALCEAEALATPPPAAPGEAVGPERRALLQEVRVACLQGLLLCLDRDHRLAFLLGELFQLTGSEAADVLSISPEAFRQRLARARGRLVTFLRRNCGLMRPDNPCQCAGQLPLAVRAGWVNPERLRFSHHPVREADPAPAGAPASADGAHQGLSAIDAVEVEELGRLVALYRDQPQFAAPETLLESLRSTLAP